MQFDLIMTTQATFMASLIAMLGGAYYFSLMKNTVPLEYQSSVATSAVYCFMAAIMYGYMNYKFGLGTDTLKNGQYPTTLRYIDWIVTTPLIVLKFPQLLGSDEKGNSIATLVIVADVIMVLFGYIGETAINATLGTDFNLIGFAMFGVSMLAWMFILFILKVLDGLEKRAKFLNGRPSLTVNQYCGLLFLSVHTFSQKRSNFNG